uniref:Aminotransferase-like plant mobile domain-containing protein n=1 Tax=Fagus sylvatica TaxID=28930 RepID=A0A2N9FF22_FAGSY
MLRGSEDNGSSSDSVIGSPEPHGDILGRPTVDPWYRSGERFPSVPASLQPPPADWEWLVMREDAAADVAWTPNFREIRDLQIQRNEMLAVPLVFDFQCSRAIEWADWIDLELADRGFCDRLEQAGVLRSILISRCSNMYRDTEALRQLVRRWCPSTHTFFFAHGELTVTLEDVENHWLLPILGVCFPLAPLLLGQLYAQLDLLHAEELAEASCHIVTTAFNSSIVHTFLWEHALEYIKKGRKPYEARNKFASMPEGVVTNVGDFQGDVPAVYCWVGSKFYDHGLVPSLDSESKICWRPYGVSHRGFVYESVMSGFSNVEAQDYTLIAGDMASLTYLSATNAGWLPVLSSGGLQFTVYSAHRVRKQFGFDQEIPAVIGIAADEIPTINPFLRASAFTYWSGVAPRVIVPSGDRIGVYTIGMSNYWRGLMAAMVEFRNNGRGDISHLLESYTSPLPHPRLFVATNTMTTYANRQCLGYAVWHHENSQWVIHDSPHPPLWLRDHPHVAAPGKVPSSRGRRTAFAGTSAIKRKQPGRSKKREAPSKDSLARASKKKKTSATRGSKEVLILEAAVTSPPLAGEDIPEGVSAPISKKPMRKTRARKRTFVPPAFPSVPSSIAARVAARKSSRGVVYSEKRSKQRADSSSRIPIEIPDDLDSSSSSSDPSGATAEEIEGEDAEVGAAETVSGADDFAADISSADIGSIDTDAVLSTSSEKNVEAGASTDDDDEVSMDGLEAVEASSESAPVTSASKLVSAEEAIEEHAAVGVVTDAERVVETTPIAVTSSGGTVQGGPSGSDSRVDPSLLDSSPSTRQYVWRARRGSIVSTDSERTTSAIVRVPTPPSPLPESDGVALTPITIVAEVSATTAVPESEVVPTAIKEIPVGEEGPAHVLDIPEGNNFVESIPIDENPMIDTDFDAVIEEELAQGPVDDVDMADAHDSYDEILVETEDHAVGAQAADIEVTAPVATRASPTKTGIGF